MLLQLGDKNPQVLEIQKLLSMLGYDLVVDGHYGARTQRSVKAFQKKAGLINDGIVGPRTYDALKAHASQKRIYKKTDSAPWVEYSSIKVNQQHRLSSDQYIKEETEKTQIFLHFTASGPSAPGVIDYWESNQPRVATSFVIDGEGEIYECFSPQYWSYHLGIKGTRGRLDKTSIGIEICNWGPLKKKGDDFYAWPENYSKVKVSPNKVYSLPRGFRNFQYYEAFDDSQIDATEKLCEYLVEKHDIKVQYEFDYSWFDYDYNVIKDTKPGIWSHTTVRKDKYDLYPDHRVLEMLNRLANKYGR